MSISDYAVVYDISSDAERNRVDKALKGFGFRVQKSVFECRLNRRGKEQLIEKLKALNIETGFIKVYRLEYSSKDIVIGDKKEPDIDDGAAFIV
jgi:CRISPR-associated protein Cas2